jgi:hypothetical protein
MKILILFFRYLHPFNQRKETTIKVEIETFLCASFIYLVPLIESVSNPVMSVRN